MIDSMWRICVLAGFLCAIYGVISEDYIQFAYSACLTHVSISIAIKESKEKK